MLPPIEILLEEFELLTLDQKAFFIFTNEEELEVCVSYDASYLGGDTAKAAKHWRVWFKLSEQASQQECSRAFLPSILNGFKVSQLQFRQELAGKLLMEAAYADEMVRNVKNLLGEEALRESIMSTQLFMDGLRNMVSKLIVDEPGQTRTLKSIDKNPLSLNSLSNGISSGKKVAQPESDLAKSHNSSKGHQDAKQEQTTEIQKRSHLRIITNNK